MGQHHKLADQPVYRLGACIVLQQMVLWVSQLNEYLMCEILQFAIHLEHHALELDDCSKP